MWWLLLAKTLLWTLLLIHLAAGYPAAILEFQLGARPTDPGAVIMLLLVVVLLQTALLSWATAYGARPRP